MFSLEKFNQEYETDIVNLGIADRTYRFHVPKIIERFIDPDDPLHEFPLWAKIWESSIVLAGKLANRPVEPNKEYLEIGSGIGMVGIVAASFGHNITMTEYAPHARTFARANAVLNQCVNTRTMRLDWNNPDLNGQYDYIVGSEIVYKESDINPLKGLFKKYLKPDGEIILAGEMRSTNMEFFKQMDPVFSIRVEKKIIRAENQETRVILPRLKFK